MTKIKNSNLRSVSKFVFRIYGTYLEWLKTAGLGANGFGLSDRLVLSFLHVFGRHPSFPFL